MGPAGTPECEIGAGLDGGATGTDASAGAGGGGGVAGAAATGCAAGASAGCKGEIGETSGGAGGVAGAADFNEPARPGGFSVAPTTAGGAAIGLPDAAGFIAGLMGGLTATAALGCGFAAAFASGFAAGLAPTSAAGLADFGTGLAGALTGADLATAADLGLVIDLAGAFAMGLAAERAGAFAAGPDFGFPANFDFAFAEAALVVLIDSA